MPDAPFLIAGLVLMGGRATRMGGGDKALVEIAGRPLLAHLVDRFRPQVGPLALSANGDPARLSHFGLPVIADPPGGPAGPLGGVLAGLAWAAGLDGVSHLATIPGDAPSPPENLVARLAEAAGAGAAVAHGRHGVEPLHALWPVAALQALAAMADAGLSSPKRALEALGAVTVAFDVPGAFSDVDTPDQLAALRAGRGGP